MGAPVEPRSTSGLELHDGTARQDCSRVVVKVDAEEGQSKVVVESARRRTGDRRARESRAGHMPTTNYFVLLWLGSRRKAGMEGTNRQDFRERVYKQV